MECTHIYEVTRGRKINFWNKACDKNYLFNVMMFDSYTMYRYTVSFTNFVNDAIRDPVN